MHDCKKGSDCKHQSIKICPDCFKVVCEQCGKELKNDFFIPPYIPNYPQYPNYPSLPYHHYRMYRQSLGIIPVYKEININSCDK